jgi:hypothetical protein
MTEPAHQMEILCRLYLELANVVPAACRSSRELKMLRTTGMLRAALRNIAAIGDPRTAEFAARTLTEVDELEGTP